MATKKFLKRHSKKETFKRSTGEHRHRESESDTDTQKLEQEQRFNQKYMKNPKAAAKVSQSCSALPCHGSAISSFFSYNGLFCKCRISVTVIGLKSGHVFQSLSHEEDDTKLGAL